jgi:(2Fe-2S) ferredoxin
MKKPTYHLLICNSYRTTGEPKGVCHRKEASTLPQYLETEIQDRGLDAMVTTTSCMKMCERGPVLVVYPQAWWYAGVDEGHLDLILDGLERNEPVSELLLA